jgi:hypothetical protein
LRLVDDLGDAEVNGDRSERESLIGAGKEGSV